MMKNFKIFQKLFLSHTAVGLFSVLILSAIFYVVIRDALIHRTIDQLSSINILKKNQIESYFINTEQDLIGYLHSEKKDERVTLSNLQNLALQYHFQNVALLDSVKQTIYSTGDGSFAREISDSLLHACDPLCIIDATVQQTKILYVLQWPLENKTIGYLVVQDKFSKIQKLLDITTGMGNTGESYLVALDQRMRSASRFMPATVPSSIRVNTKAVTDVFSGISNGNIINDYRGARVLSYYRMLETSKLKMAIISEIDFDEAMKPIIRLRNYLIVITLVIIGVILAVTFSISNAIAKPILSLKEIIVDLSKGVILNQKIEVMTSDEVGAIALAVHQLADGLKRTTLFAYEIGSGRFDTPFTLLSEKDELGKALIHMRDQLKTFSEKEIRLVREKTAAVLEGQEQERKRIILELHDGVGQMLTAINLHVDAISGNAELKSELKNVIHETISEVKRISYNVMPNAIVDFGLEAALKGLCNNVKKYSGLDFDFRYIKEADRKLKFDVSIAIFRIVQEGLNNIVKHANASRFELHVIDKEDEIYLLLRDNGKGFVEAELVSKNGLGLKSIRERAMLLQGSAEIYTAETPGTIVEVHIPVN
jgi:two-component system NarL family sensor kinase